jgi:hypothetical protein
MGNPAGLYTLCKEDGQRGQYSKEGYRHLSEWVRDAVKHGNETDRQRRAYLEVLRSRTAT